MAADSKKESSEDRDETRAGLGEALKKVFTMGTTAAFLTEETIRSYLGDLKLPKEVIQTILQGASKSKDEITQRVTKEIVTIISKVDWAKEIQKFAETNKFRISAEIEIIKKESAIGQDKDSRSSKKNRS
ncbi:MAG: hypothetical protein V4736_00995 [Bdellovibrionota bacterium]